MGAKPSSRNKKERARPDALFENLRECLITNRNVDRLFKGVFESLFTDKPYSLKAHVFLDGPLPNRALFLH